MICIKTNLKKIPEKCNKCKFSKFIDAWTYQGDRCYPSDRYCMILDKRCPKIIDSRGARVYSRLPECPLFYN